MPLVGEAKRAYQREWMSARRTAWIEANGPCAQCGSSKDLEVDHIDPSLKEYNPREIWSRRAEVREHELAKCQVLCRACHKAKSDACQRQVICENGHDKRVTGTESNSNKCSECRRENQRKRRARIKALNARC